MGLFHIVFPSCAFPLHNGDEVEMEELQILDNRKIGCGPLKPREVRDIYHDKIFD